ncbi:MAG: FtsB family cell division protein, partial [Candidatus Acidiferrales bacterium]
VGHGKRPGSEGMTRFRVRLQISPAEVAAILRKSTRQILGFALLLLLVHDIFGAHGFVAMRRTQKEIEQIRAEIGKLNEENKSLAGQVTSLKSDPRAIEHIAREDMGLARPGEMIFKLPNHANSGDAQQPDSGK